MSRDLTEKLNGSLEDKVDRLIAMVQSIDSRVESMDSRLKNVETRLESLETKVDQRLRDTRPMWEAVQTQLTEVESSLRGEIQGVRAEMEKGFRLYDRRIGNYLGEFDKLRAYQRDLEDRVDEIEGK